MKERSLGGSSKSWFTGVLHVSIYVIPVLETVLWLQGKCNNGWCVFYDFGCSSCGAEGWKKHQWFAGCVIFGILLFMSFSEHPLKHDAPKKSNANRSPCMVQVNKFEHVLGWGIPPLRMLKCPWEQGCWVGVTPCRQMDWDWSTHNIQQCSASTQFVKWD